MQFSDLIVPILFASVLMAAFFRKTDPFSSFMSGAKEGMKTSLQILPALVGLMTCIGMLRASGALDIFCSVLTPFTEKLGIPAEVLPLALIRPLSGSGSLSVCRQILAEYGPDSLIGRTASVLQGSGETTFYVISLYLGSAGVSRTRHAVPAALIGDLVCLAAACWTVRIFF